MGPTFTVTVNDASKTTYLDNDGNEIPAPLENEPAKPIKGGKDNANQA